MAGEVQRRAGGYVKRSLLACPLPYYRLCFGASFACTFLEQFLCLPAHMAMPTCVVVTMVLSGLQTMTQWRRSSPVPGPFHSQTAQQPGGVHLRYSRRAGLSPLLLRHLHHSPCPSLHHSLGPSPHLCLQPSLLSQPTRQRSRRCPLPLPTCSRADTPVHVRL